MHPSNKFMRFHYKYLFILQGLSGPRDIPAHLFAGEERIGLQAAGNSFFLVKYQCIKYLRLHFSD